MISFFELPLFAFIIILLFIYKLIEYYYAIHKPIIHSLNPLIKSLDLRTVYPHILFPNGWVQSYYQLKRKIRVLPKSIKKEFVLTISEDVEIKIIMYEPSKQKNISFLPVLNIKKRINDDSSNIEISDNVLLIHGLNGTADSTYIKGMANVFLKKRCRVFCYNARGALHPPKSNIFSHHGLTSDIKFTVEYILKNNTGNLILIGFSLGSNWVAKLLGEYHNIRIIAGIAVCCPFDYLYLHKYYKHSQSRFINYLLTKNYKRYIKRSMINPPDFSKCKYIEDVDKVLLDFIGENDLYDFYKTSSCIGYIKKIKIPFLFINTLDDPIIPKEVIPIKLCLKNKNTGIILLKGGHLGFFTNNKNTMAEEIIEKFYDKLLEKKNE